MIILKSKIKILREGKKPELIHTVAQYPKSAYMSKHKTPPCVEYILEKDDGSSIQIKSEDLDKKDVLFKVIKLQESIYSKVLLDDETIRIIDIVDSLNALSYIQKDEFFSKLRAENLRLNNDEKILNEDNKYIVDKNTKAIIDVKMLDKNKIARKLFNVSSSKGVTKENAKELQDEVISANIKDKLNFLSTLEAKRDTDTGEVYITKINNKKLGKSVCMNPIDSTNLKVGRVGRVIVGAIRGNIKNVDTRGEGWKIRFKENRLGKQAFVIIDTKGYLKGDLLNVFKMEYFDFVKYGIVGVTDIKNVSSLFFY